MFGEGKRFKSSPVFDETAYPLPPTLKRSLELISVSFNMNSMRKLNIMDTSDNQRLYGLITHYEANNFCWIQPTRTLDRYVKDEYHKYLSKINSDARHNKLEPLTQSELKLGLDIIAQYEVDNCWYRAMIVEEPIDGRWLVIFIDYGNYQRCTKSRMAKIVMNKDCNHYHVPMQSVCCRLYNIVPRLPQHRNQIDIKLESFYANNADTFLELIVRKIRRDFVVDCDIFFCKSGSTNDRRFFRKHIGQSLVDEQLATFADPEAAYAILPKTESTLTDVIDLTQCEDEDEERLHRKLILKREVKIKVENQDINMTVDGVAL